MKNFNKIKNEDLGLNCVIEGVELYQTSELPMNVWYPFVIIKITKSSVYVQFNKSVLKVDHSKIILEPKEPKIKFKGFLKT